MATPRPNIDLPLRASKAIPRRLTAPGFQGTLFGAMWRTYWIWLLIVAFAVYPALCACRSMTRPASAKTVARACCRHDADSSPKRPHDTKDCPYCAAGQHIGVIEKNPAAPLAPDFAHLAPAHFACDEQLIAPASFDVFSPPLLPASTLLGLHCALVT
jgi:hypothetical protein